MVCQGFWPIQWRQRTHSVWGALGKRRSLPSGRAAEGVCAPSISLMFKRERTDTIAQNLLMQISAANCGRLRKVDRLARGRVPQDSKAKKGAHLREPRCADRHSPSYVASLPPYRSAKPSYSNSMMISSTVRLAPGWATTFFTTQSCSALRTFSIFMASITASF